MSVMSVMNKWGGGAVGAAAVLAAGLCAALCAGCVGPDDAPVTCTVVFDGNGGGVPEPASKTVTYGAAYGALPEVSRANWTFGGWYTEPSGGTLVTANTVVTAKSTHTLYAGWDAEMVRIPAAGGTLTIEARDTDPNGVFHAGRRVVTLSAFTIANHETTWRQWKEVVNWGRYRYPGLAGLSARCGNLGESKYDSGERGNQPVTNVSWRDAVVWCNAYSEMKGKTPVYYSDEARATVIRSLTGDTVYVKPGADGFRLPTEAEWETAARGGDPDGATNWRYRYAGSSTIGDVAWYVDNADGKTHAVGLKTANAAGLYDMSGNVWEWCFDWYGDEIGAGEVTDPLGAETGDQRVYRGGAFDSNAADCAVTYRGAEDPSKHGPDTEYSNLGFRVVCAPPAAASASP